MRFSRILEFLKRGLKWAGFALATLLCFLLLLALIPKGPGDMASHPEPAADYSQAVQRAQAVIDSEAGLVCDVCGTRLLTHGQKTARAAVLIHGLTNSPEQFVPLGEELYADGYNVLIVRMPWHGLRSHTVSELRHVTSEELRRFADQSVDIGVGLGEEVTVVGLSGGGTIAGWTAQNRGDVDRVVMIAPLFGLYRLPHFVDNMLTNIFTRLPDIDFTMSSEQPRASVYPGWSTRGVAEFLLFARGTWDQASETPPAVRNLALVTNGNDHTISSVLAEELVSEWEGKGAQVTRYQFPASLSLPHDDVGLDSIGDKKDQVYPVLINIIEGRES